MEKELLNKSSFSRSSTALLIGSIPVMAALYGFTEPQFFVATKQFQYSTEVLPATQAEDAELTRLCMGISEKSLAKDWLNEEDERWNMFLID